MVKFWYRVTVWTLISSVVFATNANANGIKDVNSRELFKQISGAAVAETIFKAIKINNTRRSFYEFANESLIAVNTSNDLEDDNDYGPWLTKNGLSINGRQLIRNVRDSSFHGFNPEAYKLSTILNIVRQLKKLEQDSASHSHSSPSKTSPDSFSLRATLDSQLTESFIKLATHFGRGAVRASKVQRQLFRKPPKIKPQDWLDAVSSGKITVAQAFDSLMPQDPAYHRLTNRMHALLTEKTIGSRRIVVNESVDNEKTNIQEDLQSVKLKLIETGALAGGANLAPIWDEEMQFAVEIFQQRNGIQVSGELDSQTRKAMNRTVDEDIQAIALSLERWRWMPRVLGHKHLFVNLPDYSVQVRKGGQTMLSMPTVIGAPRHATPMFSEDLQYIVFNPTWTVPKSITNREMIPKERKKPGYLKSKNFDIMRRENGHLIKVPYEDVTEEDYAADRFPYVLQQRSGEDNALGKMKFMMPNPYNIYLHDTQAKDLFSHHDRAYSHGCIRLSDPEAMARTLLQEDGFTADEIEEALALIDRKLVRFKTPIPTHMAYLTTWIDEEGGLNQRADVYNHDEALINALKSQNTLLSTLDEVPKISAARMLPSAEG